jgi:hypothetical protein
MTFADFFPLNLFLILIIFNIIECVSVIWLQLVLPSFSLFVILAEFPNVYASITLPYFA